MASVTLPKLFCSAHHVWSVPFLQAVSLFNNDKLSNSVNFKPSVLII